MRRILAVVVPLCLLAAACEPTVVVVDPRSTQGGEAPPPAPTPTGTASSASSAPQGGFGNIQVKDANGNVQTYQTTDVAGVKTPHSIVDSLPPVVVSSMPDVDVDVDVGAVDQGSPAASHADAWKVMFSDGAAQLGTASNPVRVSPATSPADQPVVGKGTAGSPSGGVVSVQGVASGMPMAVEASELPLPTGAATESTLSTISGTVNNGRVAVAGAAASGAAVAGNPVLTAGSDGTNARSLSTDSSGRLNVNIISGAGSGGTAMTDDSAFTPATTAITPAGAVFDDVSPNSVDEGHAGGLRISGNRNLYTTIRDAAGNERGMGVRSDGSIDVNIISGAGSGGTAMTDDSAFTPGTTSITPMGAMFDDVAPDSVNEGDGLVLRASANRNLYVTLRDGAGNERGLHIDAAGALAVAGVGASGAALSGNPVRVAGSDGTNTHDLLTDDNGRLVVVGAMDEGDSLDGSFPVYIGGNASGTLKPLLLNSEGALLLGTGANLGEVSQIEDVVSQSGESGIKILGVRRDSATSGTSADGDWANFTLDSNGKLWTAATVSGTAAAGAAVNGNPVLQGGSDGTNARTISTDTSGRQVVVGAVAAGSAVAGNPVQVGGSDGTNARTLKTDTSGQVVIVGAGTAGSAAGGILTVQGSASGAPVPISGTITASTISTSVTPGTSAAHLGKAEDAAHSDADTGVFALSVRHDTASSTAGTTGDYAAITTDSAGRTWTRTFNDSVTNTSYWSGITSASTQMSTAIDTSGYRTACFTITEAATSTPVGTFGFQGSIDNTNWHAIYLDQNRVDTANTAAFSGGTTISVSSPAGPVVIGACIEAIYPLMRIIYTRSSGGTTNMINASSFLRAN